MNAPIDLTDTLFAQRSRPRGDEASAHVADLYGCLRATWYRRNGYEPTPFTREKLAQFAIGRGYEMEVGQTLAAAGHKIELDLEVNYLGLTGHPDIVDRTDNVLIEVKTTEAVTPKEQVSVHHAVQASAYALALGIPRAIVLVKHAGAKGGRGHLETTYEVNPEGYRALIEERALEILEDTVPGAPIPPADPGELAPWGCSYCDWQMCSRNPKYVAPITEETVVVI